MLCIDFVQFCDVVIVSDYRRDMAQ